MKTTRRPALRNRRPGKGPADVGGPTRTILTPRGAIVVGMIRHELERAELSAAYHGRILEDPIDLPPPEATDHGQA